MKTGSLILLLGLVAAQAGSEPPAPSGPAAFGPSDASVSATADAFTAYAQLTHRTVLRPATLYPFPVSPAVELPDGTNAAVARLENELAGHQIEVVRDGDSFARFLPAGWRQSPLPEQFARIGAPPGHDPKSATNGFFFPLVDSSTLLYDFYAPLAQRTLLRPAALPNVQVTFQTATPLTRDESLYAFKALLALNGIAAIDDGKNLVQVAPLAMAARIQARAPEPAAGASLIQPRDVPVFMPFMPLSGQVSPPRPRVIPSARPASQPTLRERLQRAYNRVYTWWTGHPPPPPPPPTVDRLVAFYARLVGLKPVPSPQFGSRPVVFLTRTPLTKPELLYAIETTLALDNLALVPVGGKAIRAGHISERGKGETNSSANSKPL